MRCVALALVVVFALASAARADVLHVPGEFSSIAFAVEAAGPGDTILIAAGTYDEQVVVVGADGLLIRGQGQVVLTGTAVDIGLVLDGCVNTTVERLRFTGQSLGLRVTGCTDVTVRKCRAEAMDELGFQALDSTGTLFDRCTVDGALDQGLQLVNDLGSVVLRCTFRNVGSGLTALDADGLEVDRLRVEHATSLGILLDASCAGADVHHSRFVEAGSPGIQANGTDLLFRHDLVLDAAGIGVELAGNSERIVLDRVRVTGSGGNAFVLDGQRNEARDCKAVLAGDIGFLCSGSGKHLLQDGRVKSPANYGIIVGGLAGDCTLLDNRVTQAPENGIETNGDRTVLTGNRSSGSGIFGFLIQSDQNVLTDNRAKGSGILDLLDNAGTSIYVGNHFGTEEIP